MDVIDSHVDVRVGRSYTYHLCVTLWAERSNRLQRGAWYCD